MTTYNGESFIAEQLASFLDQQRLPDELIVCDDGSTDTTVDIVQAFAQSAPFPVTVVRNASRLGFSRNFENALSRCTSDIVLMSDQDDVWFPDKIARVIDHMTQNPDIWVLAHDGLLTNRRLEWNGATKIGQIRSGYGGLGSFATGALTAVRREFLTRALRIPHEVVSYDIWLHRLSGCLPGRRVVIEDRLQSIRRHDENTSDWIVNSVKPIGRADILRDQASAPPCLDYGPGIQLIDRLLERLEVLATWKDVPIETATRELKQERAALAARQRLIDSGPVSRRLQAMDMLARGQYHYFTGIYSFLRDMLR